MLGTGSSSNRKLKLWNYMSSDFSRTEKSTNIDLSYGSYLALKAAQEVNSSELTYVLNRGTRIERDEWTKHIDITIEKLQEKINLKMNHHILNLYDTSHKVSYFCVLKMEIQSVSFWEHLLNKITNKKISVKFSYYEFTPLDKKEEQKDYTPVNNHYQRPISQEDKIDRAINSSYKQFNRKERIHNPFGHDIENLKIGRSFTLIDGERK